MSENNLVSKYLLEQEIKRYDAVHKAIEEENKNNY